MVCATVIHLSSGQYRGLYFRLVDSTIEKYRVIGETQEGMAQRIGGGVLVYQNWERGRTPPRTIDLARIAAVIPDPGMRAMFWIDINVAGGKLSGISRKTPMDAEEAERLRYINDALIALEILDAAAAERAPGAKEELRAMAESLSQAAGRYSRTAAPRKEGT